MLKTIIVICSSSFFWGGVGGWLTGPVRFLSIANFEKQIRYRFNIMVNLSRDLTSGASMHYTVFTYLIDLGFVRSNRRRNEGVQNI